MIESFDLNLSISEIVLLSQHLNPTVIFSRNLFLSRGFKFYGKKILFQEVMFIMFKEAIAQYREDAQNKIVIIKTQIKNNYLEIHISHGGLAYYYRSPELERLIVTKLKGKLISKNYPKTKTSSLVLPLSPLGFQEKTISTNGFKFFPSLT